MADGSGMCKVLFGIFFGVLSIMCVAAAFMMDEITKETTLIGTEICGTKEIKRCFSPQKITIICLLCST